ncbi:uncharacterized protein LOC119584744 [Penaeus monodon]|uniref:uncharacterized protein LOC119584744 n=1 Tax=Penaeus monodon TaxID=6687 RepID=UPI0018A74BFB|nr:uncharacterized protein LOC119584744 [Penaeus monodon]
MRSFFSVMHIRSCLAISTLWLLLGSEVSTTKHDLFKHRECRQRRGDVADIPDSLTAAPSHPRNLKVLSRPRRFMSWPEGSTLTMHPGLSLPYVSYSDGYQKGSLYLGFPMTLRLPTAPLRLAGSGAPLFRRSLDQHRNWSFSILQDGLNTFGLPGRSCVLKTVCEIARQPVDDLGLLGDIINLIFSAGYGEGSEGMYEFVAAEQAGRRAGDCEGRFPECPLGIAGLLQSGLSYLLAGLSNAGSRDHGF